MQKKFVPLIIGLCIAFGVFIGDKLSFSHNSGTLFTSNVNKDKLMRLIDLINYEYVDEVNTDSIVDITVNSILDNLDPHSSYIPKKDLQKSTENMKGDFVGIGVIFYTYNDTVTVIRPLKGGPSYEVGIKAGDRIIEANGEKIHGKNWRNEEIIKKLKGTKNTYVDLKIYRAVENNILEFKVKRSDVPIISVDAAYMLSEKLGYIKINRFAESTFNEFKKGLEKLQDAGLKQLVLDLRDNPGGFMHIAEQIADEFLEEDKLIVFTKNKKGKVVNSYATSKGDFEEGEVFVLINENSASASEIIAGSLQDNDAATIVGRRSFGKGLVQREMALGDGSAVRLTISRYYTPSGRSIQRPYKKGDKNYYKDYYKRLESGELSNKNRIEVADSLKFTTPQGKIVYGGGGIIPDEFVPINLKMKNQTIDLILLSGVLDYFVFEDLDKRRTIFRAISKNDFIENFQISDELLFRFRNYFNQMTRYKIAFTPYAEEVKLCLKATMAQQLYGTDAFTQIINSNDAMLTRINELTQKE